MGFPCERSQLGPLPSPRGQACLVWAEPQMATPPSGPLPSWQLETSLGQLTQPPQPSRGFLLYPSARSPGRPCLSSASPLPFSGLFPFHFPPWPHQLLWPLALFTLAPSGRGTLPLHSDGPCRGSQGSQHFLPGGPRATRPAVLSAHRTWGLHAQKPLVRSSPGSDRGTSWAVLAVCCQSASVDASRMTGI